MYRWMEERRRLGVCSFQFQLRRRAVQKEAEVSKSLPALDKKKNKKKDRKNYDL